MVNTNSKVLACVDRSHFADTVADYAAWAARRMAAPLEFLHVIDRHPEISSSEDYSGAIGFDAQELLLNELSDKDAALSRSAREQARVFLNRLRERAIAAGVTAPDVRQRHGALDNTLVELQDGVRLYVFGRRGVSAATTRRDLGRNVERMVRALHKPILTVTEGYTEPSRILFAFDGSIVTRRGVEMVATSPLFKGLPIQLLMSGKESSAATRQLEWAQQRLTEAGFEAPSMLVPGDAENVIAKTVITQQIDLLIMGAYAHSPLRSLLFGSTTTDLLRAATIPTLLLR